MTLDVRPVAGCIGAEIHDVDLAALDDDTTAAMTKAMRTQAISRWLGHRLTLEALNVAVENETIWVEIKYRIVGSDESRVLKFAHEGEPS